MDLYFTDGLYNIYNIRTTSGCQVMKSRSDGGFDDKKKKIKIKDSVK